MIFITMKMDSPEGGVGNRAGHKVGEKPPWLLNLVRSETQRVGG